MALATPAVLADNTRCAPSAALTIVAVTERLFSVDRLMASRICASVLCSASTATENVFAPIEMESVPVPMTWPAPSTKALDDN
jgi:hypothetical protein